MGRPATQPGSHSPIEAYPYKHDEMGRLVRVENRRQATLWRARCVYRTLDGRRLDVQRQGRTRAEAEAVLKAALNDLRHTSVDTPLRPSMAFIDAGTYWLSQIERPGSGRVGSTVETYRGMFTRYLDAEGSPLRGLTLEQANDVQRLIVFLQALADEHGSGTAKTCRSVVSGILTMSVQRNVLPFNAARSVPVPKSANPRESKRDHQRAMTSEEHDHLLTVADELAQAEGIDPRTARKWLVVADVLAFLKGTGARISEARLLRWERVDLTPDGHRTADASRVHFPKGKTLHSERSVNLPEWLAARLRRRAAEYGTEGYVFRSPTFLDDSESFIDRSNLQGWVRIVYDKAGLEWAISHTERRTVVTTLLVNGLAPQRVADQVGHANPAMTLNAYAGRDSKGDKADMAGLL